MTYRRLRPTKNISTEKLKKLSDKVCDKIKEAAYESMVNAINGDKDSKDKIVASSYYILHIQQEFRDYCAVIAGKYENEKELSDISECVSLFCMDIEKIIKYKNIQFTSSIPQKSIIAYIDRKSFKRVLSALVLNSAEHTTSGGKIEVRVEETARTVKISVYDNGSGMDEETLKHCTEPLYSRNRFYGDKESVGLGLTMVKYFIQDFHGHLKIKSFLGKSTKVEIVLPKVKEPVNTGIHSEPSSLSGYDDTEVLIEMAPIL